MTAKTAKAPTKKPKLAKAKAAESKAAATKVKPEVSAAKTAEKKVDHKRSLRLWNLRLGTVLLLLAIAIIVFADSQSAPVTMQYLAKDELASEAAGQDVLAPAIRHLWDVQISWLVAKFLAIFGVMYLLVATLLRKRYEAWLERGVNNLRWVGFGLGGGTAVVVVAMLSGISDVSTLTLMFGAVVLASILASAVELLGPGRKLRRLLGIGSLVAIFLPWIVLARHAVTVPLFDAALPMYLYYVYAVVTLFVVGIGLAVYLRVKQRGKWANTFYAERMFMLLGFLASVVLALQIFAGTLQP